MSPRPPAKNLVVGLLECKVTELSSELNAQKAPWPMGVQGRYVACPLPGPKSTRQKGYTTASNAPHTHRPSYMCA